MLNIKPSTSLLTIIVLLALLPILPGCALVYGPNEMHLTDRQTNCTEAHTWGQNVGGSSGPSIQQCAAVEWN